ncbi:MAG: ABC transporter ATP-binding protein [Myxococcota bacterium]
MSSDEAPPLELQGVVKRYGDFIAVSEVSLRVERGEIFALLGPNGAGKTTLISCITGLTRADAGSIRVFGADVLNDFRQTRRDVGLVPQEVNFDPFFTPRESLMIQMGLMGTEPDRAHVDALLRTFALYDHRDAYTRALSGGMKRRLLVAKALVHRPRLLFLDEPTAGVDVELRQDLWAEVVRLRDEGTTVILTTHYLEEAEELSDRIGVLRSGELIVVEDREALMDRHRAHRVVLQLDRALTALPDGLYPGAEIANRTLTVPFQGTDGLQTILSAVKQQAEIVDLRFEETRLEDVFMSLVSGP